MSEVASGEAIEAQKDSIVGPVEWHQYKKAWLGFVGSRIVCAIDQFEGMPCEAYSCQMFSGVFTSVEAAKEESTKVIVAALENEQKSKVPLPSIYTTMLRGILASLEQAEARQRQPEIPQANAGGKA